MAWTDRYRLKGIVPGVVVTKQFGSIDFSRNDVPEDVCDKLVKSNFPYLELLPPKKAVKAFTQDEKAPE